MADRIPRSGARRRVVHLAVPALIVGVLALVALWRIGAPLEPSPSGRSATARDGNAGPAEPLTAIAQIVTTNAIGRRASLEHVEILDAPSPRTLWVGSRDQPAFAVLDPDVKRTADVRLTPGSAVTLIGLVRPAPEAAQAAMQWNISAATANRVHDAGVYLHVVEIGAP